MNDKSPERDIARGLDRWWASLGREFGPLTRPQRRVMLTLAERETAGETTRVGDIAALLRLTTAGATRMLDTLEGLGYASRFRASGADQRQVYVALSPAGREALREANRVFHKRVRATLEPLSQAERDTLADLLARLALAAADDESRSPS